MLYVYVMGLAPRRWQHGDDSVTRPPHRAEKTNAGRMTDAVQWDLASRAAPTRPYCGSWTREGGAGDAESISATARNVLGRNIGSGRADADDRINQSIDSYSQRSVHNVVVVVVVSSGTATATDRPNSVFEYSRLN